MPRVNLLPQKLPRNVADPLGRSVARLGITPNMVSLFGFAGNAFAAWLITREALLAAGCVFLFFSALDLVDGAVARATNQATPFGAVFDAVLDRASEALVLVACAWYFAARGEQVQVVLTWAALVGSVSVSYMRARAEMLGLAMRDGFFRRQERVALVGLGLLFDALAIAIWPLAVLSNLTALQRLWMVARAVRSPASPA
ncbi:MAG: CDP-alcohol phosphatidyltransferase family protein [Thermoflexaceae bacterium]|nr:CDP-alcohol phosphatidyltransferase family protein [Thermoflexaceae bacterium]